MIQMVRAFVSVYRPMVRAYLPRLRSERGQDLIEYAALGGLIAAALVAAYVSGVLTTAVNSMASNIKSCIDFDSSTKCAGGI